MSGRRGVPDSREMRLAYLGLTLIGLAFLVLLHQFLIWGYWWEPQDILSGIHHETIALWLTIAGVVLILVSACRMRG